MSGISHTLVNRTSLALKLATVRGVDAEFLRLTKSGEATINKAVEKLRPDLHQKWQNAQRVASFRCAVRNLILKEGYSSTDLIDYIEQVAGATEPQELTKEHETK